jgi:hypothetical protein
MFASQKTVEGELFDEKHPEVSLTTICVKFASKFYEAVCNQNHTGTEDKVFRTLFPPTVQSPIRKPIIAPMLANPSSQKDPSMSDSVVVPEGEMTAEAANIILQEREKQDRAVIQ